jgi:hypothetical protein
MVILIIVALVVELLTFFVLWYQGFWIAFAAATLAGVLAIVGGAIVMSLRQPKPRDGVSPPEG